MGAKAGAQQQVDSALTGLDVISTILAIGKNPGVIDQMRSDLIESSTISEERRQEARDAVRSIADAQAAARKLQDAQKLHESKVAQWRQTLQTFETEKSKLVQDKQAHELAKSQFQSQMSEHVSVVAAREKAVEKREGDLTLRLSQVAQNELAARDILEQAQRKQQELQLAVTKHKETVEKFEARKKKLAAAAAAAARDSDED